MPARLHGPYGMSATKSPATRHDTAATRPSSSPARKSVAFGIVLIVSNAASRLFSTVISLISSTRETALRQHLCTGTLAMFARGRGGPPGRRSRQTSRQAAVPAEAHPRGRDAVRMRLRIDMPGALHVQRGNVRGNCRLRRTAHVRVQLMHARRQAESNGLKRGKVSPPPVTALGTPAWIKYQSIERKAYSIGRETWWGWHWNEQRRSSSSLRDDRTL